MTLEELTAQRDALPAARYRGVLYPQNRWVPLWGSWVVEDTMPPDRLSPPDSFAQGGQFRQTPSFGFGIVRREWFDSRFGTLSVSGRFSPNNLENARENLLDVSRDGRDRLRIHPFVCPGIVQRRPGSANARNAAEGG